NGLQDAVQKAGCYISDKQADYVVVGLDRTITYEKIATTSLFIQKGATFISTNKDPAIPNERGMLTGNGALTAAIEKASGKQPYYIGKPESIIMETALIVSIFYRMKCSCSVIITYQIFRLISVLI